MKILIIDDEEDMRLIISVCLTNNGFEVLQAASGEQAIQLALTKQPDAILVDYVMPDINGLTLMNQIQNEKSLSGIPFIFLTAKSDTKTLADLKSSGAKGIIEKPFNPETLANTVQKLLNA